MAQAKLDIRHVNNNTRLHWTFAPLTSHHTNCLALRGVFCQKARLFASATMVEMLPESQSETEVHLMSFSPGKQANITLKQQGGFDSIFPPQVSKGDVTLNKGTY